jgi:hypothetical protein
MTVTHTFTAGGPDAAANVDANDLCARASVRGSLGTGVGALAARRGHRC